MFTRNYPFRRIIIGMLCLTLWVACKQKSLDNTAIKAEIVEKKIDLIQDESGTIKTRFTPPTGYVRSNLDEGSFDYYLRNFPLLPIEEEVHLYDGSLKHDQSHHASILDIDVGRRDLQQCADAVMRLRAEYLWKQKRYSDIAFDFTNGWKFGYSRWRKGDKLSVNGNTTKWIPGTSPKESYDAFRKYMDQVFAYAGTLSLAKELTPKSIADIAIGDVFIVGGSPGHAVIVVDVAENESGDKAFMIAQSYMPAQQIHILKNKRNPSVSPWYLASEINDVLYTPEWKFGVNQLKSF